MALRTSTQVMSVILSVFGSGAVSGRLKAGGAPLWAAMLSGTLIPALSLPRRRSAELRAPLRRHGGARHFLTAQIDLVDAAGVADLLQRIGVEHDEIGIAAGRDQAGIDLGDFG